MANNACPPRITAAAGTELAGTVYCNYVIILFAAITFTTNSAFFGHAPWLDQTFVHCPRFLTAAVRKRLGRVSVPVWLVILSEQLGIDGLVEPLPYQLPNPTRAHPRGVLCLWFCPLPWI